MFDPVITIYESGLGVGIVDLICIMVAFFCIIFAIADYRIALYIATLFYTAYFIILYEGSDANFYKPLMLLLLAIVILILSLLVTPNKNYYGVY